MPVTNTGDRRGAEVVQCYVAPPPSPGPRPPKELKAFAKVWLDPGEHDDRQLTLDAARSPTGIRATATVATGGHAGTYELHVGRSSVDVAHVVSVER